MHKESSITTPKPVLWQFIPNGGSPQLGTDAAPDLGWNWVSDGAETPNFFKMKRSGQMLPANPYTTTKVEVLSSAISGSAKTESGDVWEYRADSGMDAKYCTRLDEALMASIMSEMDPNFDKALQAAVSSLAQRYFDLGTFIAELRETISSFKGLLKRFINLFTKRSFNDWANAWLEYRYAWRPLWSDIKSFVEATNGLKHPPGYVYKERKGESYSYNETSSRRVENVRVTTKVTASLSIRGTAETLIEPSRFRVAPFTVSWEATRLSFMIDWFISVGSALASLEALVEFPDLQTSAGYQLQVRVVDTVDDFRNPAWSGTFSGSHVAIGYKRSRFPLDVDTTPQFQFNFDLAKLLDMLLIATQRFR